MSRWISLIPDDLKAAGYGSIVDKAKTVATGSVDPVDDFIASVTAEVRNAVRAGNKLDIDETKIPHSLKRLAVRMVLYGLMERLHLPLNDDQKKEADRDEKRLQQLYSRKEQVEAADNPDATEGAVNPGNWNSEAKIIMRTHPVALPALQYPPTSSDYANPEGPADA